MSKITSVFFLFSVFWIGFLVQPDRIHADELDIPAIAEMHLNEARSYTLSLNAGGKKALEFQPDPIFKWQNLTNQGGQLGAIYVWVRDGRPEVIGTVFSQPEDGKRNIIHEFHTLTDARVTVNCTTELKHKWNPRSGFVAKPASGSPSVAETPVRRLSQMRALSQEFTGHTQQDDNRIELRLAPQPLIRYQPARSDVLDGAIFAYLSSAAGTDPEFMLLVEARKTDETTKDWTWHTGIVRFTERDLVVQRKGAEIYSSITDTTLKVKIDDNYQWCHNADETYSVYHAKFVPEMTKAAVKP